MWNIVYSTYYVHLVFSKFYLTYIVFNSREELKQHTMQEHTDNKSEGYNK